MEDYPRNLTEFEARFSSEGPAGSIRSGCAAGRFPLSGLRLWKVVAFAKSAAAVPACGRQTSVTAGTIFQDTRSPLPVWFRACGGGKRPEPALWDCKECWASTGTKGLDVAAQNAARDGGFAGRDVEVDESYWGGLNEGRRGRNLKNKALIAVAAQEDGRGICGFA